MGDLQRIKPIFSEALGKKGAERQAYLDQACGRDPELRAKVEGLLKAHEDAGDFLEAVSPASAVTYGEDVVLEGPGTTVGRYKLLEKIGEGGMAVVYMAEQKRPIRRRVALKLIKLGMDSQQVIARLEAERQALAMLDHPNVAKVLDAGQTRTGRPYFVMELVRGVAITEYCDTNNLTSRERLELFVSVCNAIQHAHQNGIIHRDIKPTNILVTVQDERPIPKVIDFGIAKAVNQRLTEKTLFTHYAQIIGTPEYMSPEQAEMSALEVDTRTDVYSLGVLLYELLTGTTPFGGEELRSKGYAEIQRIIRETDPVKPSTRLSKLGESALEVAKHRSSKPELLQRSIRGDLDWIVLKTLEKDRSRRYQSAHALSEDIEHHLKNEPVAAAAPSLPYRLQKLLRRRRTEAIFTALCCLVLIALALSLRMWHSSQIEAGRVEALSHAEMLSNAHDAFNARDFDTALKGIGSILESRHVGPRARLLRANILLEANYSEEAIVGLEGLLDESSDIAGTAHLLLARLYWESELDDAEKKEKVDVHRSQAERLLPETADSYYMRAMNAVTTKESMAFVGKALALNPGHYESLRLRAQTYRITQKFAEMEDDALAMIVSQSRNPRGYALRAIARRGQREYAKAVEDHDLAIKYSAAGDRQYVELHKQRCETLLEAGEYRRLITDAEKCLDLGQDEAFFHFHALCAHTALGEYKDAASAFRQIRQLGPKAMDLFVSWSIKYVFNTLGAGKSWHHGDDRPQDDAFFFMNEADEYYHEYAPRFRRVITNGFGHSWSPDGGKIAFSVGLHSHSGVAVCDLTSKETEMLITPGKSPAYSPDGQYIAFERNRQVLPLEEISSAERRFVGIVGKELEQTELWIMRSDGTQPRRVATGVGLEAWSTDSQQLYYQSYVDYKLYSVDVSEVRAEPIAVADNLGWYPSLSPDARYVAAFETGNFHYVRTLKVVDLLDPQKAPVRSEPLLDAVGAFWAPNGNELSLGGDVRCSRMGLWIFSRQSGQLGKVLNGLACYAKWSPDGSKLAVFLGHPVVETWITDLPKGRSTVEALGILQTRDEHHRQMAERYERILELTPDDSLNHGRLAACYSLLNEKRLANQAFIRFYTIRIEQDPNDGGAHNNLAWLYAANPQAEFRDGAKAVEHATKACELTNWKNPNWIDTLAGAYAEKGDFE
ncbi:MAG: protein kinase, partial [Phycisphaerales bacterium]